MIGALGAVVSLSILVTWRRFRWYPPAITIAFGAFCWLLAAGVIGHA